MNSPTQLQQIAKQLRAARVGLAADNRAAASESRARVILVRDTDEGREYPVEDFFLALREDASALTLRIARAIKRSTNRYGITRVAVIVSGIKVSRIVDVADPRTVGFGSEFTRREAPAGYFN